MAEHDAQDLSKKGSKAGRKPSVTEEEARQAVEERRAEGKPITVGGVKRHLRKGAPKTIERLLEKIGALTPVIQTASATPIAIDKIWQQSLDKHSQAIRAECQGEIDKIHTLLQQTLSVLLDIKDELREAKTELQNVRTQRDQLQGKLSIEHEARQRAESDVAVLQEKVQTTSKAAAVMQEKLSAASTAREEVKAQLSEARQRHDATLRELERSKANEQAAAQQAEAHLQELTHAEAVHQEALRLKDEHCNELYVILQTIAQRDVELKAILEELGEGGSRIDIPASANSPGTAPSLLKQLLGTVMQRKKSAVDRPDETDLDIPF